MPTMTLSQQIARAASHTAPGHRAAAICQLIRAAGLKGVARQSAADSAMLHMIRATVLIDYILERRHTDTGRTAETTRQAHAMRATI